MIRKLSGLINFFKKIFRLQKQRSIFNPRYQLSFDDDYFNLKKKARIYRFKSYGDFHFPEFTYEEIKTNKDILYSINPSDLLKISKKNFNENIQINSIRIEEILQDNQYKLTRHDESNFFSGDEVCDNPALIEQLMKLDLFKIAYNTGFERGRKITKLLLQEKNTGKEVKLSLVKKQ